MINILSITFSGLEKLTKENIKLWLVLFAHFCGVVFVCHPPVSNHQACCGEERPFSAVLNLASSGPCTVHGTWEMFSASLKERVDLLYLPHSEKKGEQDPAPFESYFIRIL
jgi:hypothetical protein